MKIIRLLLITLLSIGSFLLLSGTNVLQINDVEADAGDPITVEVEFTNTDQCVGYQFDVPLPTGFTYQNGSVIFYRLNGHSGLASVLSGNILRILVSPPLQFPLPPILGNSGLLCTFVLNTPTTPGEYPLHLQNVVFGNAAGGNLIVTSIDGVATLLGEAVGYDVILNVAPAGSGTVSGAGEYFPGDPVSVSATPAAGYLFVNWTDSEGVVSTANPYNFTMPAEDVALTANFSTVPTYTLTINVAPSGAGTATGAGSYIAGAPVTVTASPGTGYYFVSWTKGAVIMSLDNPYNFNMPAENITLVANFSAIPTYTVTATVDPAGSGLVLGAGVYEEGDLVTMMATANPGYQFVNWTDEMDVVVSASNPYTFTMPDEDVALTANFIELAETYDVTFKVNMTGAAGFNPATDDVYLSGTFNGWTIPPVDPEYEMVEVSPWNYQLTLQLPIGTYQYKYYYMDGATPVAEPIPSNRYAVVEDDLVINDAWGILTNIAILHDAEVFVDAPDITVDVEIVNSSVFVAFQFIIQLPAGFTYQPGSIAFSGRQANHTINAAVLPGNQLQILATSLTQSPFMGNNGNVCSFVLDFTAGAGAYPLNFTTAIISDALANNVLSGVDNGVLTIKAHSNVLIINDEEVLTGNPMTVELAIDNTQQFVAFQCDVQLPAGFTYVPASIQLVPGRKVNHTISATVLAGNKLRILSSSLTNAYFLGNEGPVATFVLNTPANPGPGDDDYPCPIVAPYFISNFDGDDICTGVDPGVLTILAHQNILEVVDFNGLCNRDQTFQVAITNSQQFAAFQLDVVMPAGFTYVPGTIALNPARKGPDHVISANVLPGNILRILSTSPTNALFQGNSGAVATFVLHTATIPGTCPLYVNEVENAHISSALGEELLTGTEDGCITIANQNLFIIHDASQLVNHPVTIEVEIDNTQDFVAFQADIAIPSGFSYVNGSVTLNPARKVDHTISAAVMPGNILRVISSSLTNAEFLGFNGTIFTFILNTPGLPGPYNLNFSTTPPYNIIIISSPAPPVNLLTGTDNGVILLLPDVNCPDDFEVCIDEEPFLLTGGTPEGGVYTGPGVSGNMFYPAMAGVGIHTITYTYTYPNLISGSCTFEITVNPLPVVTCPANFNVCIEAEPFALSGGLPVGGVYSGTGVSGGMFDPEVAGPGDHMITYTYTDENTCVNFCTYTIHVYNLFQASIAANQTICYNTAPAPLTSTVTGGAGNYTYQWWTWNGAPVAQIPGATGPTYQPPALMQTSSYVLQVFDDCGMIITNPVTITVYPQFLASIAANQTICYNTVPAPLTSTVSGGQGNYTYQWWTWNGAPVAQIPGATGPTYQPPALTQTTSYVLQVFDYCGMIITDPVTITVYDEFVASIAADQTICYNTAPAPLTSTVSGGQGNYTYQWWTYDDGPVAPIEGATAATYQPPALMETTSYVLQVFDYCGMIITDPVTITVYDEFVASIAADQTICYNTAPALLTSTVSGGQGNYTYQWWTYDDGPVAPIEGATAATYQPPALMETTSYVLQVFDYCGMIITDPVIITVYDEFVASIAADQTICYNTAPALLTSTVSGGQGNYTYQWWTYDDGPVAPIEGATAATYQPPALMETTSYVLQVFDYCGMIITEPVTITVYAEFVASIAANQTICYNTAPAPLTSTVSGGQGNYTYQWWTYLDGPLAPIEGATGPTYQPPALTQTTSYVLQVFDYCGMIITDPVTITVYAEFIASIAANQTICYNTAPALLTSTVSGGQGNYTYQWWTYDDGPVAPIEGATAATYQPPALMETTSYVLQVFDYCGMIITDPVTITVYAEFVASIAANQTICYNTVPALLTSTVSGGQGNYTYQWWTWNGAPVAPITGATGPTYQPPALMETTSYVLQVFDYCGMIITTPVTITVYAQLAGTIAADQVICYNTAPALLTSNITGGKGNYTYQWQKFIEGEQTFEVEYQYSYPDLTNPAAYDYNSWTEIGWAQANVPTDQDIVIQDFQVTATKLCTDYWWDEVKMYVKSPAGTTVQIWQGFANNGCTNNFSFITDAFDGQHTQGQWLVYFTDSYGDGGGTAYGVKITVGYTYTVSGTWMNIPGATAATYQPPVLTDTTMYRLHVNDFCGEIFTDEVTIDVTPLPTANAGEDDGFCENQTYTLNGTATNYGSVVWTTAGDGTFNNAAILNATYTPGDADIAAGDVTLTLTAHALNECPDIATDQVTLEIGLLPTVNAGDDGAACEDGYFVTLGWTTNAWTTLWTTSGDGYFEDPTSTFTKYWPGDGDLATGHAILTLTATAVPPCTTPVSDQVMVTFIHKPTAGAGPDATICGTGTHTLNGTAANYASITWSTSGDGTFSNVHILNPVYTPGVNDITSGSAVLTLTATPIAPCEGNASDAMTLTIIGLPQAFAGADAAVCAGNSFVLTGATASNFGSLVWTTSGSGTFVNPYVVNATYNPSPGDIADGTVVLTLTAYAIPPCGGMASDAMVLTITTPPTAFAGDDFSVCSNQTVVLDGTADNYESVKWTTAGDGTFSNPNILDPVYTPGTLDYLAGTVQLTLTAYAEAPCGDDAVDKVVVTIVPAAFANAGPDDKICANELYQLSGVAGGYFYTEWTSSGDGKFNDNTLLNAMYEPGAGDILLGYANLTLTAWPIAPCTTPASDMMVLLIDPMPALPGIPTGADTVCVLTSDTTWYSTIGAENALSYVWDIFPAEAGTISGEGTVGVVNWSGEYFGPVFIKVKGVNDCGEGDFSEPFIVLADPCPGVPGQPSAELTVLVYPNPSDARFNLKITNITGKLDLSLMDITGQILKQEAVNSVNGFYKTEIDLTTYPKGVYFLRLQGDNISKVERLILR